ncbi:hypothetical protein [Brevibacillus brevis]|uniref:Uncharacterized protein n=1 Tax=Brevibacillus brevis TaxID=1393 RepID=A0ABY9TDY3_BREBE|nr:hypothetical protein [Brevibacillus brevis]WNC17864.1 hypothetical protein RGB73_30050 [Brevibacillus brevis]
MYPTAKRTVAKNSASFSFTQGDLMFYDKSIGWAFRDLKFDRTTGIYGIQTLESYTFGRPEGSVSKYYAGPSALASFDTLVALQTVEQGMALAHAPSLTIINPGEAMRLKDELSKARSVPLIGSPALPLTETGTLRIPIPLDGIRDVGGTWDFPMPTIKDGEVVVSVPTGDIVVSKPDVLNPPTTTTPDDAWTNPQVPSQVNINWRPLVMVGEELTTKFPFSIPWDVKRQLSVFNVAPQSPVLKVDKSVPVFGSSVKFKFDIDFSLFDPLAFVARWFLTIAFDIGLILALRRFLPE